MAIKGEIYNALAKTSTFKTENNNQWWQLLASLIAGAVAALVSTILLYPLDMARTRLAADMDDSPQFAGIWDCWRQVYRAQGFTALYKGLLVCLVGDVLYRGLMYGIYDGFRPLILESLTDVNELGVFLIDWMYGWLVSAVIATLLMPIDTGRRMLMSDKIKFERTSVYGRGSRCAITDRVLVHEPVYRGFWHCTRSLVRESGYARLWKGFY